MNCRYCGKAHSSPNDRCRGCGVPKSSETVSAKEPKQKQLRARVIQPKRLKRTFSDVPVVNFVIGLGAAATPVFAYIALMYVQVQHAGSEIVSGFTLLVGVILFAILFMSLFGDSHIVYETILI